jgi:hypothetical protein
VHVEVAGRAPVRPTLVAVLPAVLDHAHDAFDEHAATRAAIEAVVADRRLDVLGPEDLSILPPKTSPARAFEETSLAVDAGREGYGEAELLVLLVRATRSIEDTVGTIAPAALAPGGGEKLVARARTIRSFLKVQAELWHAATRTRLAAGVTSFEEDLLAAPRPERRPEILRAVAEVVAATLARASLGKLARGPALPFGAIENPWPLGAFRDAPAPGAGARAPGAESGPALEAAALTAEAGRLERLRLLDGAIAPADAAALPGRPPGLLVTRDGGPLRRGDYVVAAGGEPASLPRLWRRWHRLSPGGSLSLDVWRGGAPTHVALPRP